MSAPCQREVPKWLPLPAPHSRVRVLVEAGFESIQLKATGSPDDLVAAALILPEWVPATPRGERKPVAADGSIWWWVDRSPKKAVWHLLRRTTSLKVARRWPGVPPDIAFAKREPEPEHAASSPQQAITAAEWKAHLVKSFLDNSMSVGTFAAVLGYPGCSWEDGRFTIDPNDAADLIRMEAAYRSEFMERFAAARIIDRQQTARGLRLVVNNVRPEARS